MMSDIRGFTAIGERYEPQQVVSLLNRYFGAMTDIILGEQGTIDEFLGDAILAVFGAPKRREDDADRSVRCAIAMQAAMAEVNRSNAAEGLPKLEMGIALNTGNVIAGNIGSKRRIKYGFVGHPVNVTSRIEDFAGPGEILISSTTLSKLKGDYRLGSRRDLDAKGFDEALTVYPVEGLID